MRKIIGLAVLFLGLTFSPSQAEEGQVLYNKALQRTLATSYKGWTFTKTTSEDDKITVERYDDSKEKSQQWQLLSINDKSPSKRQLKKYLKKKRKELKSNQDEGKNMVFRNQFLTKLVKPESVKLVEENHSHKIYQFRPKMDEDTKALEDHIFGEITVSLHNPMIEEIRVFSKQEFSAGGAKIKQFEQIMKFATIVSGNLEESPVFLQFILAKVKGKAVLFFAFDQETVVTYSDYRKTSQ